MTTEQLKELGEALSILSAKSSVLKERDEMRALMEENMKAEEVSSSKLCTVLHPSDVPIAGPQVARGGADEAHPNHVDQD